MGGAAAWPDGAWAAAGGKKSAGGDEGDEGGFFDEDEMERFVKQVGPRKARCKHTCDSDSTRVTVTAYMCDSDSILLHVAYSA